jgi:hypothetical protein
MITTQMGKRVDRIGWQCFGPFVRYHPATVMVTALIVKADGTYSYYRCLKGQSCSRRRSLKYNATVHQLFI